jgi:copper(I)-binding protein
VGRIAVVFAAVFAALPMVALAHDYDIGSIHIDHPWARATPKGAKVGGGYLTITNRGTTADRLLSVSASAASRTILHQMTDDHGVMKMRPLDNGIEIKSGETVELKSESLHLMFEGLKEPLKEGDRVKGSLTFEKAGTIEVEFAVEAIGAKSPTSVQPGMVMHNH